MVEGVASARARVRRSVRRLVYWIGPVLILIGTWQVWDGVEARRLSGEVERLFPDGIQRASIRRQANTAAEYYAAANVTANAAGTVAALDESANPPLSTRPLILRVRTAMASGNEPAAEDVARLARVLSIYELPLRLVRDASARAYGPETDVGETSNRFSGYLSLRDPLGAHTLELIRTGSADPAVESLVSRVKWLRDLSPSYGAFAASMKASYMDDIAMDVAVLLSRLAPSEASLVQLQQAVAESYGDDEIAQSNTVDARQTYLMVESVATGRRFGTPRATILSRPALRHLLTQALQTYGEVIAAARLPWPDRLRAVDRIEDERSPFSSQLARWFLPFRLALRETIPVADQAAGSAFGVATGMANARVIQSAVAVERRRRVAGSLPDSLAAAEVPDEAALDPFSGKPMRYVRDGNSYTVYSVGRDFRDDGGAVTPVPTKGQSPGYAQSRDIGIRVRDP